MKFHLVWKRTIHKGLLGKGNFCQGAYSKGSLFHKCKEHTTHVTYLEERSLLCHNSHIHNIFLSSLSELESFYILCPVCNIFCKAIHYKLIHRIQAMSNMLTYHQSMLMLYLKNFLMIPHHLKNCKQN